MDSGIEAQVHGPVMLNRDVDILVGDPAFAGTRIGQRLNDLADKYGIELQWHCGFRLPNRDVPDDFRGPAIPSLAQHIAGMDGFVDAEVIGRAAASLHHNREQWRELGDYLDVLRTFRQLWHVVVHFGRRIQP